MVIIRSGRDDGAVGPNGAPSGGRLLRPYWNYTAAFQAEILRGLSACAALPWEEGRKRLEEMHKDRRRRLFGGASPDMLEVWREAIVRQFQWRAKRDLMCLGIALEAHHLDTGMYPRKLAELRPYFGGDMPLNAATGESYHYRPIASQYKLFAVVPLESFWKRRFGSGEFPHIPEPPPLSFMDASDYGDLDGEVLYPEIPLGMDEKLYVWREGDWWNCFAAYVRPI